MNYLGEKVSELELKGARHTAEEISVQPKLWEETFERMVFYQPQVNDFLKEVFAVPNLQIILTGAGTSAFIGEVLQREFQKSTGKSTRAISTTDLVSHPAESFQKSTPTLLVSFARSGDSPESVAAFDLAEAIVDRIFHLIITCNPDGKLAQVGKKSNACVLLMPEKANDKALAMTGSFTCMLLAGILTTQIDNLSDQRKTVKKISEYGTVILNDFTEKLKELAASDFKRVVFLGSGPLKGIAEESQLKVQELTDGTIICKHDSFLGFRHGPKAVIDESTLIFYLFSSDPYVYQYEVDLVKSIRSNPKVPYCVGVFEYFESVEKLHLDLAIAVSPLKNNVSDVYFTVCSVLPAQILGFYKSLHLGLRPDIPSKSGSITRVVQGVTIYPYQKPAGQHTPVLNQNAAVKKFK